MDRDDFDLGDFGDLEEPSFPDDDSNLLPPDTPSGGRPPRNTTFLIVAVALVVVFLLGLAGIALFVISNGQAQQNFEGTSAAIAATNNFVGTAIAATATAKSWTATPTPTDTPTDTPTSTLTPTETSTETPTPTPTIDDTGTALALASEQAISPDDQTATAVAFAEQTIAAGGASDMTLTAEAALSSPSATPCPDCGGPVLTATSPAVTPSITATCTSGVPCTGLFDGLAGGGASPGNLALFGFAALGLVGIIFGARLLRVKQ